MANLYRISMADYQKAPGLSRSYLCRLLDSPLHAEYAKANPTEPTDAMILGSATHTMVLEPQLWDKEFIVSDASKRSTEGKNIVKTYTQMGLRCLNSEKFELVKGMRNAVFAHPIASKLLSQGEAELSVFWVDAATGLPCKARPDYLRNDGIVVDLKTCADAGPRAFQRAAWDNNYAVQAGYYLDGLRAAGVDCSQFVFIAVESTPPHAVAVYAADGDFISMGADRYHAALDLYAKCKEENRFPGYPEKVLSLAPPKWAFYQ